MNIIGTVHRFVHSLTPSFKLGATSVLTLIATIIGTFLPQLRSKNVFQNLFYITLALFVSLLVYALGIVVARILDTEKHDSEINEYKSQLNDKKDEIKDREARLEDLNKNVERMKNKIDQLEQENRKALGIVEVEDPQRDIKIKINGKANDDPVLKKLISAALKRYRTSDEEQRQKWEEELLNQKW